MTKLPPFIRSASDEQLRSMGLAARRCVGDWLTFDYQFPGGCRIAMRNDPVPTPVIGYFYYITHSHGAETVSGDPHGQAPPDGWILNHLWYGEHLFHLIKVGEGQGGLVVFLGCAEVTFTIGPS